MGFFSTISWLSMTGRSGGRGRGGGERARRSRTSVQRINEKITKK